MELIMMDALSEDQKDQLGIDCHGGKIYLGGFPWDDINLMPHNPSTQPNPAQPSQPTRHTLKTLYVISCVRMCFLESHHSIAPLKIDYATHISE